jgi:signal transduction histidine kinase
MLINIIDNALKYSLSPGTIEISMEKSRKAVTVEFSNASAPISPEELPKLFDQFYRVDRSHSSQTPGFGLGLSIAQQIAVLHGGTISVSHSGGVTTLAIFLPIR